MTPESLSRASNKGREQQNTDFIGHIALPSLIGALGGSSLPIITGNNSSGLVEISAAVGALIGPILWKGLRAGYVRVATNENIQRIIRSSINFG